MSQRFGRPNLSTPSAGKAGGQDHAHALRLLFRVNHRLDPLFFPPAFVDAASALETMQPLIIYQVLASEIVFVCQSFGKNKAALYSPQGIARVQEMTKQSPNNSPVSSSDVIAPKLTSPLD